jgi:hypothetical protein
MEVAAARVPYHQTPSYFLEAFNGFRCKSTLIQGWVEDLVHSFIPKNYRGADDES